jgi:hypothetical protein
MGIDDRPADRESHAHALGLGGEQRIENAIGGSGIEADAGILDGNERFAVFGRLQRNPQIASAVGDIAHRLNTVSDQIEQHLLQLNSVGQDWPIAGEKLDVKHNPAAFQFAAEDGQNLLDRVVDIDSRQFKPRLPRERVITSAARRPARTRSEMASRASSSSGTSRSSHLRLASAFVTIAASG